MDVTEMKGAATITARDGRLASALVHSSLLGNLDEDRRTAVLARLRLRRHDYVSGEALCREGERATSFWLLTRGTVEIAGHTPSGEVSIETRGAGDLIGELAAMRPGSMRSATVTARGHDTEAYCFSIAALDALASEDQVEVWRGLAIHVAAKLAATVPTRASAHQRSAEKEALLRRFVNDDVLGSIRSETHEAYECRQAVIWFSDLVGFSAMAARVSGEELAATIQAAMSAQSDAIEAHGGLVDKFIGDGLMAYWLPQSEAPAELRRVADAALDAAFEAQARVAEVPCPVEGGEVAVRIGLNVGCVHIGNFGSGRRWAFTLIGQPVILASRIESAKPPEGEEGYGAVRASTDLAALLAPRHRGALPDAAEVQVKTDRVTFIHRKPE